MSFQSQHGGRHEGFEFHFEVICQEFPTSTKREFNEFLKLAGTPYCRIDWFPGSMKCFIHFREEGDAHFSLQRIAEGLFKGADVIVKPAGSNWYVERQRVHEAWLASQVLSI